MATINQICTIEGTPKKTSIKKRLARAGIAYGLNDELSKEAIKKIKEWYGLNGELDALDQAGPGRQPEPDPKPDPDTRPRLIPKPEPAPPVKEQPKTDHQPANPASAQWRDILPALPLPMLGLAASYGVFYFSSHFVPTAIALIEACGFELVYIGLGVLRGMDHQQREVARRASWGAVLVSVLYNTITAALHMNEDLLKDLPGLLFWGVAFLHGAPLAILAFYVSDILFHRK